VLLRLRAWMLQRYMFAAGVVYAGAGSAMLSVELRELRRTLCGICMLAVCCCACRVGNWSYLNLRMLFECITLLHYLLAEHY
jgi:hypothetical protein